MKVWLGLLMVALAGCVPLPEQRAYEVSEIQVLFPENTERWTYFYGEPQVVQLGAQRLSLTQGSSASLLAVPGTLLVNGEAIYREIGPAQPRAAQTSRSFFGLQYVVRASREVKSAWLYNGGWSRLGSTFSENTTQVVEERPGIPRLEGLSQAENAAVLGEILARRQGRPVVVYEFQPTLEPNRYEPAPRLRRLAALAVQYGLETELIFVNPNPNPTLRVLLQGSQAAYTTPTPAAYLASNQSQLLTLWGLATGNQVPPPPSPAVDFKRSRVVAFFWGQKPTGGYSVEYVRSQLLGSTLRITLRLVSPAPSAIVTQALTSPFVMLEAPGRFTRVEFVEANGQLLASTGD
jgi:hypothetical protein